MILAYVNTIEQDVIDVEATFHIWKITNTIDYTADKWSNIMSNTVDGITEYGIIYNTDMQNIEGFDINKVKDISTWSMFQQEELI